MYNFERIYSLNESLKTCLENDYGLIYITQRIHNQNDEVFNNSDEDNYLELFFIPKKEPFIIEKITSIDGLKEVQKEIKKYYEDFLKNFGNYFEQVESQLDEKTNESFEIIYKIIQNRKKKLFSKLDKFEKEFASNAVRLSLFQILIALAFVSCIFIFSPFLGYGRFNLAISLFVIIVSMKLINECSIKWASSIINVSHQTSSV